MELEIFCEAGRFPAKTTVLMMKADQVSLSRFSQYQTLGSWDRAVIEGKIVAFRDAWTIFQVDSAVARPKAKSMSWEI
jgi:hypothetical protein